MGKQTETFIGFDEKEIELIINIIRLVRLNTRTMSMFCAGLRLQFQPASWIRVSDIQDKLTRAAQDALESRLWGMAPVMDSEATCNQCNEKGKCAYAFDPYNTNGDCLARK